MEDVKVEDDDEDDDDLFKSARGLEPRGLEPEPAKVRLILLIYSECRFHVFSSHNVTSRVFYMCLRIRQDWVYITAQVEVCVAL